jgi:hypothetical protein
MALSWAPEKSWDTSEPLFSQENVYKNFSYLLRYLGKFNVCEVPAI